MARKAAIDDAIHQAQALAAGFNSKLGPVYSVLVIMSLLISRSPVVRMMSRRCCASIRRKLLRAADHSQFDDQVDVVFSLNRTGRRSLPVAKARSNLARPGASGVSVSPGVSALAPYYQMNSDFGQIVGERFESPCRQQNSPRRRFCRLNAMIL